MSVYKRVNSKYWWFNVCRGRGKPRLQGSTGKTDRKEAEAVEHVIRLAHAGKTPRARLLALVDA